MTSAAAPGFLQRPINRAPPCPVQLPSPLFQGRQPAKELTPGQTVSPLDRRDLPGHQHRHRSHFVPGKLNPKQGHRVP
ncbi:Hypothetical predicted protein [Marmota monax]|uniref:Uncharacterized protein n=1 Tax=Marmota monax TaxID=9995 RepID=A0A5E4CXT4_MARMO|nr:hypothetical protein GHT09_018353 [Marmota monax]VTJ86648.1 Hypothetical predicted protein [Marmota monax]